MGDGGVACLPLQQQQHSIMDRFSIPDKALCGGKNGNNGFNSKSLELADLDRKKKMKVKKQEFAKKGESEKVELRSEIGGKSIKEVENSENSVEKEQKEEVEEGELGSLKWPRSEVENGEFLPEKSRRSEIEKGEIVNEKWRRGEVDKGEIVSGKWRRSEVEKGEIVTEKGRRGEAEKGEFGSWRGSEDEVEKGEFIPDRWQKVETAKDDYSYSSKIRRYESGKDKGWKCERQRTPPSGKYLADDVSSRKEFNRSGTQLTKCSSRWEIGQERNKRISSKIVNEEGSYKNEYSNGKNYNREYSSSNWLKRHGSDSDSSERKNYRYSGDYSTKSRKLSDDGNRPTHMEQYYRRSVERPSRNSFSSRVYSVDKYSSRHYGSFPSSKDRHGRSPGHSEQSLSDRARYHGHRDRSPVHRQRSPHGRERSPYGRRRSPYDRSRHYDYRNRSPTNAEWSPQDRARYQDSREWTPNHLEGSPLDRSKPNNNRETNRKPGANDKHYTPCGSKGQEEKHSQRDPNGRDSHFSPKESQDRSCVHTIDGSIEKIADSQSQNEEQSQSPSVNCKLSPHVDGVPFEEQPSMEEDMDICDTPPHVPVVVDSTAGRWFYLDHFGMECGPSKLCELKTLVDEGFLTSDHLIKHLDSDRWVTVENAASPLVTSNFPTIVSECITQLVTPPEAPGNLLADTVEPVQSGIRTGEETPMFCLDDNASVCGPMGNLHIDERVGALLEGFTVVPGRELETVGEILQMTFEHAQLERWENSEGFTCHLTHTEEQFDKTDELSRYSDVTIIEATESRLSAPSEKDNAFSFADSGDRFSGRWSCKGGDWKRDDEGAQDKNVRKKLVLNDGFPLCQMPKSGYEDPRWQQKDELYFPSHGKRLDLPTWAFSLPDERNDGNGISRSTQTKPAVARGVKGTMLPVVRINACVVKDHGSFVSEPHAKVRSKERYSSRSVRPYLPTSDVKRSLAESNSRSKNDGERNSLGSWKCNAPIKIPKDCLCRVSELQLHLGDWYHLDGAGHERGPLSFSELKVLADQGSIQKGSSVFRKFDNVWVPITSATETSEAVVKIQQENNATSGDSSRPLSNLQGAALSESNPNYSSFHSLHPQFIGYTRGKLHELVMKSYKSREFAAAINEVLDPWINAKQPKKEVEKHIYWKSEGDARAGKRARLLLDESEDDYEMEEDLQTVQDDELTFEDLCGDATFSKEESACFEAEMGSWGLLDGRMLARIFHFLRSDMKSLAFASLTCKHWRSAERFYKGISRQVDLSSVGINCTDSTIRNITNGYNKEKITSMVLLGCANITSSMLADILGSFPCLSSIDIRGCSQFSELATKFPNVNWIKSKSSRGTKNFDEPHSRIRSLKQISEKTSVFRTKGSSSDMDDFSEMKDYFDSVDRRDSANQLFHRSLYKRSKLFDARRSSSILSRDARMRRWAVKKSGNGYKRMEKFLASSLKDIMKENAFDFFVPKVAEIEDRMKNGYYIGHGLNSVKEDISRMCRDAIKVKNRGDGGDLNRIITLFIQLATHLEESSKFSHERDEVIKSWKDDSAASAASKYKKLKKIMTDKKYSRSNGTSSVNGGFDYGEYASDREIKRRLSKLNKKSMDSGSETSDDLDMSSKDGKSDSESTVSDTESELDIRSEGRIRESRGDGYLEDVESLTDDREWGARMTKASLVPPVTRKYEVIDQYVTVADVEDVQRKMRVSLPEDYAEKLNAQKNGTEESDMELPEVKDYKPRKQLGHEVVEQEVYGIDPYTHNLILDSMSEESDWPLQEKHLFIEDVLLRTLNEQVRHFTGTGNTPMMYPLQPVIQEIERNAVKNHDLRTMKLCQGILKAIDSRPDDNYVAYRKGLGVVCNKEGGFGEEDFVVEFLGEVYPAWKWFEKQDGIRSLQKNNKDPAPEFYNIYLERPKGDADGYDLVVVDAMHKANYASRICHSCRPNCEAKVTAVDGHYQIGIYAVRKIQYGEEITFDYNSVTESKDEYEASVCLCGSQVCRGSYLNLTGEGAFQKVLEEWHGILDRHQLMLESCDLNFVSEEDYIDLGRAGLGSCLLGGLPDWLVAYSARLVRFINFERTKLPEEILRHNLEEKRKYFLDICLEVEKSDAEVQAEGVYNQRLQNLALTLDKVRYVLRFVFGDPKKAPPPLEKLTPEAVVAFLWKGEGSLVEELLRCMAPHMEDEMLTVLKSKIQAHDPSHSDDIQKELQKSLLWLRDEVRNLPCTYKCRHDAAADLIHVYAYTKCFFRVHEYKGVTSPPVYISPLDLGPKYSDKLGAGLQEYTKIYGENYCLGQLIFWHIQTNAEPDCSLARASRGCLSLPYIDSFYAKVQKPSWHRVYGPRTVKFMVARMEKQPQRPWPTDRIWSFKNSPKIFGSPMMDAVLNNSPLDREMVHWLKNRPAIFQAMWDR